MGRSARAYSDERQRGTSCLSRTRAVSTSEILPDPKPGIFFFLRARLTRFALRARPSPNRPQIRVTHTKTLNDAFPAEVVKLSPPGLTTIEFRGSPRLTRFVCSPASACPSLRDADVSRCGELRYALVQSDTLESLSFLKCAKLDKALLQCRNLSALNLEQCGSVKTLMIWSDALAELDLSACASLEKLELYCPALAPEKVKMPLAQPRARAPETRYVPVAKLVLENMNARQERRRDALVTGIS